MYVLLLNLHDGDVMENCQEKIFTKNYLDCIIEPRLRTQLLCLTRNIFTMNAMKPKITERKGMRKANRPPPNGRHGID